MLFVHGFPEIWYSWRHQMKVRRGQSCECWCPQDLHWGHATKWMLRKLLWMVKQGTALCCFLQHSMI